MTAIAERPAAATSRPEAKPATALPCWCGAGHHTTVLRAPKFNLVRCSACGCYETDPPPLQGDDESAEFYTDYYTKKEVPAEVVKSQDSRNAWFWRVAEQIPSLAKPEARVADIGSGDGHFCAELKAAGWRDITGIEISKTRVTLAKKLYPEIPFYSCGIAETGIPENSLDLMVMDSVIEHLPQPVQMVRDLSKYLKPGGTLVMLTPNMESGHFRFLGKRWTSMLAPHAHIFLFTPSSIDRLLKQSGLQTTATGSLHFPAYKTGEYLKRFFSGDVKGTLWRAHQEIGGLYGRMIGRGPMLYAVATRPQ
jgi:2-polyprenyl-3-methyl-5-hydroxy-6-metoxy-1,4-benzoquinol methylase